MGEVSYKLMRVVIIRRIKEHVKECAKLYSAKAEELRVAEPGNIAKLLSLSVELNRECEKIALSVLEQYPIEVEGDDMLREYKKELIKNGTK